MASPTIKEKFVELKNSKQIPRNARPKIQRVADHLRNRTNFEKHYSPKLLSIGPIHHDNPNLKLGEKYKLVWASKYIENTGLTAEELHKKIVDNIDELKGRFSDDVLTLTGNSLQGFGCLEEKLSWILFVDGCSLLYVLERAKHDELREMNIKVDQLVLVMMDVVLLENQLPYEVLKLLLKDNNESELLESMRIFIIWSGCASWSQQMEEEGDQENIAYKSETPTHLLDLAYKLDLSTSKFKLLKTIINEAKEAAVLGVPRNSSQKIKIWRWLKKVKIWSQKNSEEDEIPYRGIEDLTAVGIRLKPALTDRPTEMAYSEGWFTAKLIIPRITVDKFIAARFLNLIAYEMSPDFENHYEICSYVAFMDSLIDHPEDVKALRSNGILYTLWSNEEVAKLFNTMGTDLVLNDMEHSKVRFKLDEHYRKNYKTWIALGFRTYFNNPWAVIAFVPAFIALALTFIQTWFTVHPTSK